MSSEKKIYFSTFNGKKQRIFTEFQYIISYLSKKKKKSSLEKYQPQEQFIFGQLVTNFENFWRNNSMLLGKKYVFKKYNRNESLYFNNQWYKIANFTDF